MGSINRFVYQKLVLFSSSFWVSVSTLFLTLFGFLNKTVFRGKETKKSPANNSSIENFDSTPMEKETETKEPICDTKDDDDLGETESPKFFFKFKYQSFREDHELLVPNSIPSTSTSKYQFLSGKDLSHYLKEPEVVNLTVKELSADSKDRAYDDQETTNENMSSGEENADEESVHEELAETTSEKISSGEQNADEESVHEGLAETSADCVFQGEVKEKLGAKAFAEEVTENIVSETSVGESVSAKGKAVDDENNVSTDKDASRDDLKFLSETDILASDSDSDSINSSHEFMSRFLASTSDGFLSDTDFEETSEVDILRDIIREKVESYDENLELEYSKLQNSSTGYEADDFDEEDSDIMEELRGLEKSNVENSGNADLDKLSEKDFEDEDNSKQEEPGCSGNMPADCFDNSENSNSKNASAEESEDSSGLETLWEHQELIEQLKMELKKVRATGLPTILEEDECPKIMEDLKPWKIEERFQYQDKMGELHKFYKSYRERMRKFDILNYQKMYAASFLQSKDPLKSISSQKSTAPVLTKVISQRLLLSKRKTSNSDPMENFIRELHRDLEVVYVGQMCLSWEILRWQYEKVLELWDSDPNGRHTYNEVAGEFQQFQVLLQRFIENEPFEEDPRVYYYIKHRCALRNLLQVPVIREDSKKDKKARRKAEDDGVITSDMLVEIMEESIRVFWRFVRADKYAHTMMQKGRKGTQIEPQDPTELELLTEVRTNLLKKEKRLKEILRGGNCILRKFQKQQEDNSDHVLHFFSQVDMKLVVRVLNMSKITTDQLIWCHNKLSRINFVSRKIHVEVEPSFLLFPC
ncbi:hypothetical protein Tsubulata_009772 [Turnera subulata]|uniref:Ribosomal protein L34Ae n=1 Tax=Turnera subulata TaxID=218843 RepID=A0A9Q0IZD7_9ROSI|nr:hypothetical protein Tsubulata_009772 [Turnera subulata]